jgi:DNA-binding NtrC family response regulator
MMSYSWPGNVRELENAIERAVVLGESDVLLPKDLPETVPIRCAA